MSGKRVLIVDDESDIREVAQLSMEIAGWEVLVASGGQEAIEIASTQQVAVVLLDVMMPDLDGPQTLRLLRNQPSTKDLPVIFLTAKAQLAEQRHLQGLGSCGVIAKPFDPMLLADLVSETLDRAVGA